MKYLNMVISESLRRWHPVQSQDRQVTKPYVMENYDGHKVKLEVGQVVWFPFYAIHMDPKYFPNPTKFDPERFSDQNKDNIIPGTYLPFGIGPRSCIANRFALMELKTITYYLVKNFKFEKCEKTTDPIEMVKGPAVGAENGSWIKFSSRN